mmetsp:Transcript_37030/g.78724  ORF Transcript_37030/g.78724 Transcript_37030/m.78724 type:complete len:128 (-) Transcript_37030:54-437(-)
MGMGGMGNMMGDMMGSMNGMGMMPGAELVMQAVQELPAKALKDPRGFLLRCAVPSQLAGAIEGEGGSTRKEVEDFTGAKISLTGRSGQGSTRVMNIEGPLLKVCAAYILMMVRYIEAEEGSTGTGIS